MVLEFQSFRRSKGNASLKECEDAFAVNAEVGRFAVADGATESAFTEIWARLLVEHFVSSEHTETDDSTAAWIAAARTSWQDEVQAQLAGKYGESEMPWYVEASRNRGAYATFLGLQISRSDDQFQLRVDVIGDTCLFHIRDGELHRHLPIQRAGDFSDTPILLASCDEQRDQERTAVEESGQSGDRIWIATDALAEWCLREVEENRSPWQELESTTSPTDGDSDDDFAEFCLKAGDTEQDLPGERECDLHEWGTDEWFVAWTDQLRRERGLRNDDMTLLVINL